MKNRRQKIVMVSQDAVLARFQNWQRTGLVELPRFHGIPEDVVVVDVHNDWQRNAFAFIITHDSFDEVLVGETIPIIGGMELEVEIYRVADLEKVEV